jgi:CheY-like chemotaxis protein
MVRNLIRQHVLVADDDLVFSQLVAACLAQEFATTVVGNGADALQLLERQKFDLAIVDLDMPRVDGFRLLGLVRGHLCLTKLALLVITSSRLAHDHGEAIRLGADAFLTKPVDWTAFPALVRGIIDAKALSAAQPTSRPSRIVGGRPRGA